MVYRSSAVTPEVVAIEHITTTDSPVVAAQHADMLLARYGMTPKQAQIESRYLDFRPGTSTTVDLPAWGFSSVSCLIHNVELRHVLQTRVPEEHAWISRLSVIEGDRDTGIVARFLGRSGGRRLGVCHCQQHVHHGAGRDRQRGGGKTIVPLGGSRTVSQMTEGEWLPIVDFIDVLLNAADGATRMVRGHSWVLDDGDGRSTSG